jgi:spore coat protein U-like protein
VRTIVRAVLLLAVALIPQTPDLAVATVESVSVSGDVVSMCTAFTGTGTLALANYSGSDVTGNTSFTVMCAFEASPTTYFTVSGGSNYNHNTSQLCGGYACRWMNTGSNYLYYQLYEDSGHTQVWTFSTTAGTGNGINGATDTVTPAGNAANMTLSVYGDIPAGQSGSPPGSYSDSVTVTVNY